MTPDPEASLAAADHHLEKAMERLKKTNAHWKERPDSPGYWWAVDPGCPRTWWLAVVTRKKGELLVHWGEPNTEAEPVEYCHVGLSWSPAVPPMFHWHGLEENNDGPRD